MNLSLLRVPCLHRIHFLRLSQSDSALNLPFSRTFPSSHWLNVGLFCCYSNDIGSAERVLRSELSIRGFERLTLSSYTAGGPKLTAEETLKVGSYNALMASSLPGEHEAYKASLETFESSHEIFRSIFPDGFAWEVQSVYSGPPVVAFKWRHWGVMKAGFKGPCSDE
ncbi:hypothetical protein Mapa_000354 [Marchantia paleacea]|nr:hypothetical protein Mapa_000354 [Marchantia paleacea]